MHGLLIINLCVNLINLFLCIMEGNIYIYIKVDEYETLMFINLYICHVEGSEIIKVSGAAKYNNVS